MNLFLSPHNDDEALFGAYIIQKWQPLVLIVTDSYIQPERGEKNCDKDTRIAETTEAMRILGAQVEFLHIPDKNLTEEALIAALKSYRQAGLVFAPAIEGGNPMHDLVGRVADVVYAEVKHYATYTKTRHFPAGPERVEATEEMKTKKLRILECYRSQKGLWSTAQYFTTEHKDEFLC